VTWPKRPHQTFADTFLPLVAASLGRFTVAQPVSARVTRQLTMRVLRIFSVLPIHIGVALGLSLFGRWQPLAALLLLIVLSRSIFMSYHYAPETRYMVEVYPPMIAAYGVTAAAIWLHARKF